MSAFISGVKKAGPAAKVKKMADPSQIAALTTLMNLRMAITTGG